MLFTAWASRGYRPETFNKTRFYHQWSQKHCNGIPSTCKCPERRSYTNIVPGSRSTLNRGARGWNSFLTTSVFYIKFSIMTPRKSYFDTDLSPRFLFYPFFLSGSPVMNAYVQHPRLALTLLKHFMPLALVVLEGQARSLGHSQVRPLAALADCTGRIPSRLPPQSNKAYQSQEILCPCCQHSPRGSCRHLWVLQQFMGSPARVVAWYRVLRADCGGWLGREVL